MSKQDQTDLEQQAAEVTEEALAEDIAAELSAEEKLAQDLAQLQDDFIRAKAEMANIQRRSQEEIKKAREYAIANFAKDLVVVKDYLEMALKDQSGNFEMLKMGVDLTLKQLASVFENHKVKEVEPKVGDKLDANLHQAMSVSEDSEQESNSVVSVMQKGYILNDRVLRAAMVVVAK